MTYRGGATICATVRKKGMVLKEWKVRSSSIEGMIGEREGVLVDGSPVSNPILLTPVVISCKPLLCGMSTAAELKVSMLL